MIILEIRRDSAGRKRAEGEREEKRFKKKEKKTKVKMKINCSGGATGNRKVQEEQGTVGRRKREQG